MFINLKLHQHSPLKNLEVVPHGFQILVALFFFSFKGNFDSESHFLYFKKTHKIIFEQRHKVTFSHEQQFFFPGSIILIN